VYFIADPLESVHCWLAIGRHHPVSGAVPILNVQICRMLTATDTRRNEPYDSFSWCDVIRTRVRLGVGGRSALPSTT
jgi:hypothetical protein